MVEKIEEKNNKKTNTDRLKWYVLTVTSNKEKSIKENILKKVEINNIEEYITRVEIPSHKYFDFKNGKKVVKEKILMPGYILVQADISYGELLPFIKSLSNVFGFLSTTEDKINPRPIPLKDREVSKYLIDDTDEIEDIEWSYKIGDKVKTLSGTFQGFVGNITGINESKKTLKVTINIFSRETPIEINYTDVEKVSEKT